MDSDEIENHPKRVQLKKETLFKMKSSVQVRHCSMMALIICCRSHIESSERQTFGGWKIISKPLT